jgi:hypothetical protein
MPWVTGDDRHSAQAVLAGQEGGGGEILVEQRAVKVGEAVNGTGVVRADDDAFGVERVEDGDTLGKELGIGSHCVSAIGIASVTAVVGVPHQRADPVPRADGDGGLVDDHGEMVA